MFKQDREVSSKLFTTIIANSGGSFTFDGEPKNYESGYSVSVQGFEVITPLEGLTASAFVRLANDLIRKVDGLVSPKDYMIGVWIKNGDLYIDLSQHIADYDVAMDKARAGDQLEIFDFASGESVITEELTTS